MQSISFSIRSFDMNPTGEGSVATRRGSITKPSYGWRGNTVAKTTCCSFKPDRITQMKIGFHLPASIFCRLTVPWSTYATVIVDTASALASGCRRQGLFQDPGTCKHRARNPALSPFGSGSHDASLARGTPIPAGPEVALTAIWRQLKNQGNPDARECYDHFLNAYLRQPPEQLGGVISTIYNYLNYFTNPDIVEVFGPEENTFDFSRWTMAQSSVFPCRRNIRPNADT